MLIFSIAMGADYSFYVEIIDTHARAFLTLNILAIVRVEANPPSTLISSLHSKLLLTLLGCLCG